jgi:hypothetical protein
VAPPSSTVTGARPEPNDGGPQDHVGRRVTAPPRRLHPLVTLPVVALVVYFVTSAVAEGGQDPTPTARGRAPAGDAAASPSSSASARRSYAIALEELRGMSPAARPGTRFELWVTWEPPATRRVRHELLVRAAVLEKIAPPVTPTGPHAVLLRVPATAIPDLLHADRFGTLSVAQLP